MVYGALLVKKKNRIILSISSDIGYYLAKDWLSKNFSVIGTYRKKNEKIKELESLGAKVFYCDLKKNKSVDSVSKKISKFGKWNSLVLAAGDQNPIGNILNINLDEFENSFKINFINQIRFLRNLLDKREGKTKKSPSVLFFAGGGTNNATVNYMAYTLAKITSIKVTELLDAEIKDTKFTILGPGWVKTKIHKATLEQPSNSGKNYRKTIEIFKKNNFYPMSEVIKCCNWLINADKALVGGRNFSSVFDPWNSKKITKIKKDSNLFKLRRYGNNFLK
jgi:short-subunit dehydrogenase